ncbi:Methylamine utilisation protein MauE [Mycobacterium basiliense]|uniref:Methylamine utilisation protein MauE n=1 Tax=Mycobacterium basiliense TaxID=2094119 RepID=A0A447GKY5_9MYCO|nr:MauE/DoxX family redox-associated membrane protein [Mycobacterium basiliense]VDM91166.1 Methylamine utilisation protein MauE [Mycobacterium basiliense]
MTMLAARILLAGVFAIAALAKLSDWAGVRRAVVAFGVPKAAAAVVGSVLVAMELGVVLLLVGGWAYRGAVLALLALTGFSAAILVNLARGRSLDCHCFGRLSAGTLGWPTLARNGCLATIAAFVALDGRFSWSLAMLALVMFALWIGPVAYRRWTTRAGTSVNGPALPDRTGQVWTLDRLSADHRPVVFIFSQPGCGACAALLPEVDQWQRDLGERVTVALVSTAPTNHVVPFELIDEQRLSFASYGITATPSAVLIDNGRRLSSASGAPAIKDLVQRAVQVAAESRFTRRGLLRHASVGLASAGVLPALAACDTGHNGTASLDTKALEVDGAWLCDQTFALCTTAPCVPSATDPTISVCDCVVVNGYSIGFKTCPERAQSGTSVRSAFSTVNVNTEFGVLSCPSGVPWANCLDVECEIDPTNPARARCQCITVKTGESRTFGGGCDTDTCTSTIWSAATPDLPGSTQYKKGMKKLGQPVEFPTTCPA